MNDKKKKVSKKKIILKKKVIKKPSNEETVLDERPATKEEKETSQPLVPVKIVGPQAKNKMATKLTDRAAEQPGPPTATKARQIFKFYCMYCGQKLSAMHAAIGRQTNCPTCSNPLTVPEPRKIPDSAMRPDTDESDRAAGLFKFFCQRCGQRLEVRQDWITKDVDCPSCEARIKVPGPDDL